MEEALIPKHGGFKNLKSFQVAQLCYDLTARFCDRYIEKRSRTHDQMVQAARSGVQNRAEGSLASGTSKKTELKLTHVGRASLGELKLDYQDYLRQRNLPIWEGDDPRWKSLIGRRCKSADEVARWVVEQIGRDGHDGRNGHDGHQSILSIKSIPSMKSIYSEYSANAAIILITVAMSLLDRQLASLAEAFKNEGGFTERLYRVRSQNRNKPPKK